MRLYLFSWSSIEEGHVPVSPSGLITFFQEPNSRGFHFSEVLGLFFVTFSFKYNIQYNYFRQVDKHF